MFGVVTFKGTFEKQLSVNVRKSDLKKKNSKIPTVRDIMKTGKVEASCPGKVIFIREFFAGIKPDDPTVRIQDHYQLKWLFYSLLQSTF